MSLAGLGHILLHFLVPLLIARVCARAHWRNALVWMLLAMLVDLDHLLATPLYDPDRCSITYHPLHLWPVWPLYGLLALWPRTRWLGVGLLVHMLLDASDCVRQFGLAELLARMFD
ncbi:DUF6122 family protein [Simiduia sp. 21SJ11W-1]|uniref:DUF6122 family protein n=1 Tax=Simiduia sp. 21SJ11W-1 TaxID=2909669 RepID=UPI00209EBFD3|nr:DUF6122 family protein [Simiduia sp. 21SJ11W-1]UTA46972.1 DUF6122 family protein [Simiduia sp. 21SJ11W-1]